MLLITATNAFEKNTGKNAASNILETDAFKK
jgi:hypothetical protein